MSVLREAFGPQMERVTLRLPSGVEARIITFGAALQALILPDREGRLDDVVLGHDEPDGYLAHRSMYGATVGRYANRLAGGRIPGGQVVPNQNGNALHGGPDGFDRRPWTIERCDGTAVTLSLFSPDGDQGFPGNLTARVTYALTDTDGPELHLSFEAETDADTFVNLTNHSFFNLGGHLRDASRMRDVMGHVMQIDADRYLPVDATMIPEGPPVPVEGTPFDFRTPRPLGHAIRADDEQLRRGQGYDHNFCLNGGRAAVVHDPASGRWMEMWTDQPGVQLYSGNLLSPTRPGKGGLSPRVGDAFCLEPQRWPDSPNRPDFPPSLLRAGEVYRHETRLRFGVK